MLQREEAACPVRRCRTTTGLGDRQNWGVSPGGVVARRWETLQVSLVLLTLLLVFFWKPILLGRKLLPADIAYTDPLYLSHAPAEFTKPHNILLYDQAYQFYPWRVYIARALSQGILPFWNPYVYCGAPFMAEDQPAFFYPLNVVSYILSPADAALFTAMARLFVAGLATYWFVRTVGGNRFGALVSAITFAFSGFMIVFLGHPHTNVAAWLPASFLTAEWLYRRPSARHIAFLALVVAAQLSGGHSETALYTLTACGLYFLFRILTAKWRSGTGPSGSVLSRPWCKGVHWDSGLESGAATREQRWRPVALALLSFAVAVALGFVLASVHVLPFVEWLQHSAEFHFRAGAENLGSWRLGPKHWLAGILPAVFPNIFGNPTWPGEYRSFFPGGNFVEQTVYVGIIGLASAATAFLVRRRDKLVLFLAILGLAALCTALRVPVFDLVNHLPLFNIASVGRFRLIYTFCFSVLAGFGLQDVVAHFKKDPRVRVVIALLTGVVMAGIPVLWLVSRLLAGAAAQTEPAQIGQLTPDAILQAFRPSNVMMYWPALVALAAIGMLALYQRALLSQKAMQMILLLLVVVDLFSFGMDYHSTIRQELVYPETPALRWVKSDKGIFRVVGTNIDLMPNTSMVHALQDIRGLDFPIRRYLELCQAMGGQDWLGYGILFTERLQPRLLNLLNVKYVLSSSRLGPKVLSDMVLLDVDRDIKVYQNLACLPRAFVVDRVRVSQDTQEVLRTLQDPEFDPAAEIILEKPPPSLMEAPSGSLQARTEITGYTPNRVAILATTSKPGFLFLSDTYYPDWQAYVDGVETEIYLADYAFRAVYLTPGDHRVEFVYEPRLFRLASGSSLAALLVIVVSVGWPWRSSVALRSRASESPEGGDRHDE